MKTKINISAQINLKDKEILHGLVNSLYQQTIEGIMRFWFKDDNLFIVPIKVKLSFKDYGGCFKDEKDHLIFLKKLQYRISYFLYQEFGKWIMFYISHVDNKQLEIGINFFMFHLSGNPKKVVNLVRACLNEFLTPTSDNSKKSMAEDFWYKYNLDPYNFINPKLDSSQHPSLSKRLLNFQKARIWKKFFIGFNLLAEKSSLKNIIFGLEEAFCDTVSVLYIGHRFFSTSLFPYRILVPNIYINDAFSSIRYFLKKNLGFRFVDGNFYKIKNWPQDSWSNYEPSYEKYGYYLFSESSTGFGLYTNKISAIFTNYYTYNYSKTFCYPGIGVLGILRYLYAEQENELLPI